MLKKETVHNFRELGDKSIDDITYECKCDFIDKCYTLVREFLSTSKDDNERNINNLFNIRAYNSFNDKGRYVTYQNQGVEYEELRTDIKEYLKNCLERDIKHKQSSDCKNDEEFCSNEISTYLFEDVENEIKNDLTLTLTKLKFKRYEALFGLGEFPFMIITIVRIGNKRYYFYQITR